MPRRAAHVELPEPPELGPLTEASFRAIRNLAFHVPASGTEPCPQAVPAYRRAAVLLSLFPGRNGDLYVILSQRATALRSHGGDTAIPGGRFEANDPDLEATARREAWEETGLPIDPRRAPKLCELQPFLSANELLVTPIVVLIIDPLIKPILNPLEVSLLFSLPFSSFLYHQPPNNLRQALRLGKQPDEEVLARDHPKSEFREPSDWHTCRDIRWLGHRVRRHTFWDNRNPIRGLTSDILIHAASIAFGRSPDFSLYAPVQPTQAEIIKTAFTGPMAIQKRRVRPRMTGLQQPVDDDEKQAEEKTKSHKERTLDAARWMGKAKM